jgi:hypothetical protein
MRNFNASTRFDASKVKERPFRLLLPVVLAVAALTLAGSPQAYGQLNIVPTFDSTITGNSNAAAIEADISAAISTIEGLYSNSVTIPVTFVYAPLGGNALLSTTLDQGFGSTYTNYKSELMADSAANPGNTVLATAIAHLGSGNTGGTNTTFGGMFLTGAQAAALGTSVSGTDATVTINSLAPFALTGTPNPASQYDLIGGLEHEIDEVMGGGGAGSTLNDIASPTFCFSTPQPPVCTQEGATDLYRYSAPGVGSYSTSSTATAYFSIDGGVTNIVNFNQGPGCVGGDFGDFSPDGTGPGQLIQNACNNFGQDEAYTTSSPEYTMMEAIGWDPVSSSTAPVPEPATLPLMATGLAALIGVLRKRGLAR